MALRIIYLLFLTLSLSQLMAQENEVLNEKKWEELTKDIDYEREKETVTNKEQETQESNSNRQYTNNKTRSESNFSFGEFKYLFMIIIGTLLLVLIIYMISNSTANPTLAARNIEIQKIENIEEHIHEVNLDELLTEFKNENDFDMAIRISFLTIVKELSNKKMIKWERQKTNWEYHSELNNTSLKSPFGQMILAFEKVWYGEHHLSEPDFNKINSDFINFKEQLEKD